MKPGNSVSDQESVDNNYTKQRELDGMKLKEAWAVARKGGRSILEVGMQS